VILDGTYLSSQIELPEEVVEGLDELVDREQGCELSELADVGEEHAHVLVTFDEQLAEINQRTFKREVSLYV